MCDEFTEIDNQHWLDDPRLKRREFAALSAGAMALALFPIDMVDAGTVSKAGDVTSSIVKITTSDGTADAFFVHPVRGRHPAVIMWPDIAGLRDAYKVMATRLARAGYSVLVVNQYYRSAPAPIFTSMAEWRTQEGQALLQPMIAAITPSGTMSDAAVFVDWLDRQDSVDTARKAATCGYCMGGPFAFRTAVARPARVGALASFHGANLVNDTADSPHLLIARMKAALLIAIAQNDDARQADAKDMLRAAAEKAERPMEIEVYRAQHGWCTIDAPVYDQVQAEKAWSRMLATFERYCGAVS
jgi:carboxymethylenebutenolidase